MDTKNIFSESGILITIFLIAIPIIVASLIFIAKSFSVINRYQKRKELKKFNEKLKRLTPAEIEKLEQRKKELEFSLTIMNYRAMQL